MSQILLTECNFPWTCSRADYSFETDANPGSSLSLVVKPTYINYLFLIIFYY